MRDIHKLKFYLHFMQLFQFKTIADSEGNEYVVFGSSQLQHLEAVPDKTAFESFENHIHLLNRTSKRQRKDLNLISQILVQAVLARLKWQFPEKQFMVYVTVRIGDSMILRFHQIWPGEEPFCNPSDFDHSETEYVFFVQG